MHPASHTLPPAGQLAGLLLSHWKRWLLPAAAVTIVAAGYAIVRPDTWQASQALIVRNDAATSEASPGKFKQPEDMKTVQETILELVRSRGVLAAALQEVGPPADHRKPVDSWPGERDVAELREAIKLAPPKGAEFGKTEVFYLEVRDRDRARSLALSEAIFEQLQARFQQVRDAKAQSMIDELQNAVQLSRGDLEGATARLTAIEKEVGSDLAELRALAEPASADSALRRTATEIRGELRTTSTTRKNNEELLGLLTAAQQDPGRLLATPGRLLDSQPALRRLKEGLVDAQLRTATLQGNMSAEHPRVRSARHAEDEVGRHLHDELAIAIRGMEVEQRLNADRETLLGEQLAKVEGRLDRLSELRAAYTNQAAQDVHYTRLLERSEQNLADARAAHASARATSLISRIDAPDAGIRPVAPTRAMIALAGLLGGLLTGLGVLLLTISPAAACDSSAMVPPQRGNADDLAAPMLHEPAVAASPLVRANGSLTVKQALAKLGNGQRA